MKETPRKRGFFCYKTGMKETLNPTLNPTDGAEVESRVRDFFSLLKPRVMSLVVFSAFVGLYIAPGTLHPFLAATAILCIAMGAGAAGAMNMWFDRDIDAIMSRTKTRALPRGLVAPDDALFFGLFLTFLSVGILGLATNWLAAFLLAFASFFYVVIYTMWLKRKTAQNIVIGGAAGAFPPMIGWAAVTGDISLLSVVLFMIIFMWTPPHFWALALYKSDDYKRANVPMLPVTDGLLTTKKHMLVYTILLFPLTLVPYFIGFAGLFYLCGAVVLGGLFILSAIKTYQEKTGFKFAKLMFGYSIFYLFALFLLLMI